MGSEVWEIWQSEAAEAVWRTRAGESGARIRPCSSSCPAVLLSCVNIECVVPVSEISRYTPRQWADAGCGCTPLFRLLRFNKYIQNSNEPSVALPTLRQTRTARNTRTGPNPAFEFWVPFKLTTEVLGTHYSVRHLFRKLLSMAVRNQRYLLGICLYLRRTCPTSRNKRRGTKYKIQNRQKKTERDLQKKAERSGRMQKLVSRDRVHINPREGKSKQLNYQKAKIKDMKNLRLRTLDSRWI